VSARDEGAYTGEVSGAMLSELGCRYAIVGHSERRSLHGESDETVAAKFLAAQRHGLQPILCVGESLEEREASRPRWWWSASFGRCWRRRGSRHSDGR
jgi:triosephosphate isomerase (TIM)